MSPFIAFWYNSSLMFLEPLLLNNFFSTNFDQRVHRFLHQFIKICLSWMMIDVQTRSIVHILAGLIDLPSTFITDTLGKKSFHTLSLINVIKFWPDHGFYEKLKAIFIISNEFLSCVVRPRRHFPVGSRVLVKDFPSKIYGPKTLVQLRVKWYEEWLKFTLKLSTE